MPSGILPEVEAHTVGFGGGLNLRDAINQLAPDEARIMENGTLNERGAFDKRLGCESHGTFGAGADRVLSSHTFYRGASAPQVLIHTSAGKVYFTNDAAANPVVWTEIATGLSTTAAMSWETFNNKAYFSNGVDNYAAWDGAAYTTFASAPKGKFLRLWKDTMWVSGITGLPDRVYTSNPGDAETFGVAGWVDIAKGDGDSVTALGSDGLFLIVWKRNRTFIIYDPALLTNRVIDFEKGCESHFSVTTLEGDLFFLSRRGFCRYLGDSPSEIISGKIDPIFDPAVLNLNALGTVYAYTYGNTVGWALPESGSGTPTFQVEYYPRLAGVTAFGNRGTGPFVIHRMPAAVFTRVRSGATEFLYGAHSTANKFLRLFAPVGTDDGATFTAILETGAFDFGSATHTKYIRRMRLLGRGLVTMTLRRNFESAIYKTFAVDMQSSQDTWNPAELWGSGTWGPESVFQEDVVNPDAYARYFTFRFSDDITSTSTKLLQVGSREYSLAAGGWGLYQVIMEGSVMGVRD